MRTLEPHLEHPFPTTRYLGSKRRVLPALERVFSGLHFTSMTDVFGGTGAVSHLAKRMGKRVVYNDNLRANQWMARALLENRGETLSSAASAELFRRRESVKYRAHIAELYDDIYYLPEENRWLDTVAQNIPPMASPFERAIAYFCLFQVCLMKRPYNLFHRRNLAVRTRDVARTFGNKSTWDKPFETLWEGVRREANRAIFSSPESVEVLGFDALDVPLESELIYLDPPYLKPGSGGVSYGDAYHFLEALADYDAIPTKIDFQRKNRPFRTPKSALESPKEGPAELVRVIERARDAPLIVVSYRSDGVPDRATLEEALRKQGRRVVTETQNFHYALSRQRSEELIIVGDLR